VVAEVVRTERLILRRWTDGDRDAFAAINSDPLVMATLGPLATREQSDGYIDDFERWFDEFDYSLWCVEVVDGPACIGTVGLGHPGFDASFTPCVEIAWRISSDHWGQGYAPEAARAVLADGFGRVGLAEIVAFTSATNANSRRVMDKLGMVHDVAGDFDHPGLSMSDPLRPHVLYRISSAMVSAATPDE
jgi:RimJ/RimL family protein N-acetyltransferase